MVMLFPHKKLINSYTIELNLSTVSSLIEIFIKLLTTELISFTLNNIYI